MPDSSFVIQLIDTLNTSVINNKIDLIQKSLPSSTPNVGIWTVSAACIGGALVLIGQAIERNKKRRFEKYNLLLDTYANCRRLEAEMKNNYRELAMAKIHVEYWWHGVQLGETDAQHCYKEHLRSLEFAREVEKNIGITKANFISYVRKFQALHALDDSIDIQLERISDLKNEKAKSYPKTLTHQQVRYELVEKDEQELQNVYYKNLDTFKEINGKLQSLVKAA